MVRDIFVSYTSSDRDWARWIAAELRDLDHAPHVHEWALAIREKALGAEHPDTALSLTYKRR